MWKGTKLYSVLFNKCPHCHEGDFFVSKNPFSFKDFSKINPACSNCGENFMKEIGFFYGSMYVSYGLTIALGVGMYLIMCLLLKLSELSFLISFVAAGLLLWTTIFRIARLVWINLFVKYDAKSKVISDKAKA